jgi:hypothetical protein
MYVVYAFTLGIVLMNFLCVYYVFFFLFLNVKIITGTTSCQYPLCSGRNAEFHVLELYQLFVPQKLRV